MERKTTSLIIALLLLLLSLVFSPLLVVPVKAYGYDDGYGCASIMHACDAHPMTPAELRYMYWAFSDIFNIYVARRIYRYYYMLGWWPIGKVYGHVTHSMVKNGSGTNINPYSTTTLNDVQNGITDVENNHPWSSFLYVGHGGMITTGESNRYSFYMHGKGKNVAEGGVPQLEDNDIYVRTDKNHHFVFLWACFNGYERGGFAWYVPYGMPHCWTHNKIGPENDGYADPDGSKYCFIGFHLASPRLEEPHNGANHLYKHWLVFFYYYAVAKSSSPYGYVNTVKLALDAASVCQGFDDFTETRLYKTGPYYPKSGPPGGPDIEEWKDTYFLGLRDPENPDDWLEDFEPGWYDVGIRVYGDGNYYIPGDVYVY